MACFYHKIGTVKIIIRNVYNFSLLTITFQRKMDVNIDVDERMSIDEREWESEAKKIECSTSYSKNNLKHAVEKVKTKVLII